MEVVDLPTNNFNPDDILNDPMQKSILYENNRPADDNLKIKSGLGCYRPMGYIGFDSSKDCNNFYNSYEPLVSNVQEILTSGLRIIYNLYQGFVKFKSLDSTKYDLAMKHGYSIDKADPWAQFDDLRRVSIAKDNLDNDSNSDVNFDNFIQFYKVFKQWAPSSDIAFALSRDEYTKEISELRSKLSELSQDYGVSIDIENSSAYPKALSYFFNQNVVFKVRPVLNTIIKSKTNDTIPSCDYKVLFDMHSIIDFMITGRYIKMPDELPPAQENTALDIDSYVNQQLTNIGNLPDLLAKKVILELCDNSHNINGNWIHFIKKFMNTYESNKNNLNVINLTNKLNYLLKQQKQDASEEVVDVTMSKVFDYIVKHPNSNYGTFLTQLQNVAYPEYNDDSDVYIKIIAVTLKKAFSHYFEDSVSLSIGKNNSVYYSNEYCREFNRKYNIEELLAYVNRVNNYNIKDFFECIIKDNIHTNLISYDTRKRPNGENMSFLYSRFKRQYVLHVASLVLLARYIYNKAKNISFNLENKMERAIECSVYQLINDIFDHVNSISNESGIIIDRGFRDGCEKFPVLCNLIKYCNNYIGLPKWRSCTNESDKYRELSDIYKSYVTRYYNSSTVRKYDIRMEECLWPIYSYDSSDLSDRYEESKATLASTRHIFTNIIKGLTESGELNVENHCYLY